MWINENKGEKMRSDSRRDDNDNHLKIDDTLISLINDYHDVPTVEIICFFNDLAKQMGQLEGNIVNKNKVKRRMGVDKSGKYRWITEEATPDHARYYDYDAYAFRGYYPGSKIPFKMSGVKQGDWRVACWVVAIGDKNKTTSINRDELVELEEVMSDIILLDQVFPEDVNGVYKKKTFRCMRPKGMPLLKKAKDVSKKKEN